MAVWRLEATCTWMFVLSLEDAEESGGTAVEMSPLVEQTTQDDKLSGFVCVSDSR